MKKSLVLVLAATLGLAACNREKKGPGGLLYTIHHTDGKEKIQVGDIVKMNFIQKNEKDSIIGSTYDMGQPQIFPVAKKMYDGDMNDVLTLFAEGDSATFKVNLDTMAKYNKQPKPEQFKNDKYLIFTAKIEKIFKRNKGETDSVFNKRASDFFQKDYADEQKKVKAAEPAKIKAYIADKGLKATQSASGLQYVIENKGSDAKAVLGDTILVNYKGNLTTKKDGKYTVFDTNIEKAAKESGLDKKQMGRKYEPVKMVLGGTVPGFNEALQLVGKGGKITAIMPSALGYGEQPIPQAGIPAFSPLVFEIEIVDIIKPKAAPATTPVAPATK